jgi:hypothetical protein
MLPLSVASILFQSHFEVQNSETISTHAIQRPNTYHYVHMLPHLPKSNKTPSTMTLSTAVLPRWPRNGWVLSVTQTMCPPAHADGTRQSHLRGLYEQQITCFIYVVGEWTSKFFCWSTKRTSNLPNAFELNKTWILETENPNSNSKSACMSVPRYCRDLEPNGHEKRRTGKRRIWYFWTCETTVLSESEVHQLFIFETVKRNGWLPP